MVIDRAALVKAAILNNSRQEHQNGLLNMQTFYGDVRITKIIEESLISKYEEYIAS